MFKLRPYQRAAIDAVAAYWAGGGGNPLVEMAAGTGKSVVIATMTRELLARFPGLRVLMLVHVKELVEQNARALLRAWPQAPLGINSAGLGRRERRAPILCAGVQSVWREDAFSLGPRDLVLIDEAHLVPRTGEGMYRTLLEKLRRRAPGMRVAGFTATGYRLDSGRLDSGEGRLFDRTVYDYGIADGVRDGWLSPLVAKAAGHQIDVASVPCRGGEFVGGELERAADRAALVNAAADEMVQRAAGRRGWLAFCCGVAHAGHVCDALRSRGIKAATVTGETPAAERGRIIRAFRSGELRCLTNANVLTTGFDVPHIDLIALLRPTLSPGLYVQSLGRGTRRCAGKADCLVLDFAGNVRRHGPVDAVRN